MLANISPYGENARGWGGTNNLCNRGVHYPDLGMRRLLSPLGINSYLIKLVNYFKNCVLTVEINVLCPG